MLYAYRAPSPLAGLKEVPQRLLIAKWGTNTPSDGTSPFKVNEKTARFLPAMQRLLGFDTVALDFEHNTLPGTPAFEQEKEPRNVAAHGALDVVPGEGVYAVNLRWTPSGEKSVKEGLHPDLSPVIKTDDAGNVMFIHSAALCRQGRVPDLQVFSAALTAGQLAAFSAALTAPISTPTQTTTMDFKKLLILLLGLDANAADTDIEAACKKFADTRNAVTGASSTLESYSASLKTLTERLAALEKAGQKSALDGLISQAIREGKLVPNSVSELPFELAQKIVADLPANIVPISQRTPDGLKAHSASIATDASASAVAEVAKQMGVTPDALKKHDAR